MKQRKAFNYQNEAYSSIPLKGRIWESYYAHFSIGEKALRGVPRNGAVLDVGCGAGSLTALWKKKFPSLRFYGIDISKKAIKMANNIYSGIRFNVAGVDNIPFKDNTFSAITCCEVIEHVDSPFLALREINRVLKKGGLLYITTPLEKDNNNLIGLLYGRRGIKVKDEIAGHIQIFNKSDIKELLNRTGFSIQSINYNSHVFGQIEDLLYLWCLLYRRKRVLVVTNYLHNKGGLTWHFGLMIMQIISAVKNIETLVLRRVPGYGIQIIAQKIG